MPFQYQGNGLFTCQHGADECFLNKIMSCAHQRLPTQAQQVAYTGCQMVFGPDRTGQVCVEAAGLNWEQVQGCHGSDEGLNLQLAAEDEQKRILPGGYPSFVPTIVANDQYSQTLQNALLREFKNTVCQLIAFAAPGCNF